MGMTVSGSRRKGGAKPEINVTPLVDVVLVLLIIFMVVTPQMESGASVDLPSIQFPDEEGKGKLDPIELTYTAAGQYLIHKEAIPADRLEERLAQMHEAEPNRRLVLRGDVKLQYGQVRGLFTMCERIGFPGVSLVVSESGDKKVPDGVPTEDAAG
ncbi:ExbD/TolR family protein [Vulgatibacter sp.]|uniref:ExbD/TolR family protein n=1 Tax=Vulgatibacter sp. TaxID=1971226 RepID=UPI00356396FA